MQVPRGKKFEAGKLGETLEALDSVTPKPKESINLKELVKGLKPKIKRLRAWDYSWAEIVELLGQQKIEISEDTLKEYMKTPRRKKDKPTIKEAFSAASTFPKNGEQARNETDESNQVNFDKPNKKQANPLKEVDTEKPNEGSADTLNKNDANAPNENNTNKLSEHDDELTTRDAPVEPEASSYQPIKLTMRK